MPQIGLDTACFLGCVLETLGYGVFSMMAGFTLRTILIQQRLVKRSSWILLVLVLMWLLSTMHWIVNVYRAYQAFLVFPEGPVEFYNTLALASYTAKNVAYATLTLVADAFATYRCYIVWNRNRYIGAIPGILLLSTAVAGYGATYVFTTVKAGNVIFLATIVPWITAWISLTLSTNVICTGLIGFRIIRSQQGLRNTPRIGKDHLTSTLIIIVESAAIYSSTLVALITSYLVGSNGQYVVLDVTISVIGITFTMIILRVSLGVSSNGDTPTTKRSITSEPGTRRPVAHGDVAVNVSRLVQVNRDDCSEFSAKNVEGSTSRKDFLDV
ncbi:hypothetical protein B0H15DRAFT_427072 [Mycena belliarum]|uniref:Uncharacterized protein n=1 Tax=Mycena belliarum TaxID=1033014 RepID=A0AAD6XNA3_9AGAR|nr:hypothetical protein B0H15DRAFT_427072 [Mycena belliae]